ncbi:MAG: hypothetical protein AAGA48_40590 [Myxococcota bacterium]
MTHEEDDEVTQHLRADAARTKGVPDDLWDRIDADLSQGGVRDAVVSQPTGVRQLLGLLGVGVVGLLLVAIQGIRSDLTTGEWQRFVINALPLVATGHAVSAFSLGHRGNHRPLPGLAVAAAWAVMIGSTLLDDWPGVHGVPYSMHWWCFGMTSLATLVALVWLTWLERASKPVVWRVGSAAAGAGLVAYVFQSVFCPGVDPFHLLVGHGAASVIWAVIGGLVALGLALRDEPKGSG